MEQTNEDLLLITKSTVGVNLQTPNSSSIQLGIGKTHVHMHQMTMYKNVRSHISKSKTTTQKSGNWK